MNMDRFLVALAVVSVAACSQSSDPTPAPAPAVTIAATAAAAVPEAVEINPRLLRRFQPLPEHADSDATPSALAKIDLGRSLFHETRLSKNRNLSCNSCHDLAHHGVDGLSVSIGTDGNAGARNSPTVLNAASHFSQFWDGRAGSIEDQAKMPVLNPAEMAMSNGAAVVDRLKQSPAYVAAFRAAFPSESDPMTWDNVASCIGAFERTLVTPGRWDRYLTGDKNALTEPEKEGLRTFLNVGCMVCHTGPLLGASMFERAGVVEPWPNQSDTGRFRVTGLEADRMMFKVPSLRNVEYTAPYFHDGSAATLTEAVHTMGKHQLGLDLTPAEADSIVTWLKSLSSDVPANLAEPPIAMK